MNSFDIDGVIWFEGGYTGVWPGPHDVIITGRSIEEMEDTMKMLQSRGIENTVYFGRYTKKEKTRRLSGMHKAAVLNTMKATYDEIYPRVQFEIYPRVHFDDDEIQAAIIKEYCPWINIVLLKHELFDKVAAESEW